MTFTIIFLIGIILLLLFLFTRAVLQGVTAYQTQITINDIEPDVNFYRDMRGRLGEYQRMRNWCRANIGESAESADKVDHTCVFYIGKKMSAMQFVFYNQNDFDLFNQHWDIVKE